MDSTLVIMAAGIGSRFGGGIKQLEPVGPMGQIIMDYSIHDALEAGFNKVVFIIRKDLDKDFREIIGRRIEKLCHVEYAYQELDSLPDGFSKGNRTKPWGTGQAILSAKGVVNEPFVVVNADDYYGKEAFKLMYDFLRLPKKTPFDFCMAGFILKNTLSDNGGVTRGICRVDENNLLIGVDETHNIVKTADGGAAVYEGEKFIPLDSDAHVSMNMWGLTPEFIDCLEDGFKEFLKNLKPDDVKTEYLLPIIIDNMIKEGKATVRILETHDKWFGVTYKEDKDTVVRAFGELIKKGIYTKELF